VKGVLEIWVNGRHSENHKERWLERIISIGRGGLGGGGGPDPSRGAGNAGRGLDSFCLGTPFTLDSAFRNASIDNAAASENLEKRRPRRSKTG